MTRTIMGLTAVSMWLGCAATAGAMVHPDVTGEKLWFTGIDETTSSGDPLPLFGTPVANGDQLAFPMPTGFTATSVNGGPSDQTSGRVILTVEAKPGVTIEGFAIATSGQINLERELAGSDAYASVIAYATIQVLEVDYAPVSQPATNLFLNVTPPNGSYLLSSIGGNSFSTAWAGNLDAALPANTTKFSVSLTQDLYASSVGANSQATIDTSAFTLSIHTVGIPEPATTTLAAGTIALLGLSRRRRM